MKRIVLAPDSFKGSLSASDVAEAMARGLRALDPDMDIQHCPMADGGEGTLDAVAAARDCTRMSATVTDANGERRAVAWLRFSEAGQLAALIEVARIVGLPDARRAVADRTTLGVGELLRQLLELGIRRIAIGLGGTSTNEAGIGALTALGARFLDAAGRPVAPTLAGLAELASIDFSGLDARLAQTELTLLTDVTNPLCGSDGATAVFGPQKGIRREDVTAWDAQLARLAALGDARAGRWVSKEAGSGAAGGLAYALMLAGGRPVSGARYIAALGGLPDKLHKADLVITGEGRSDLQTLMGKAPAVVAAFAQQAGVPVALVSGAIDPAARGELGRSFALCLAVSDPVLPLAQAMAETAHHVAQAMAPVLRAFCSEDANDSRESS